MGNLKQYSSWGLAVIFAFLLSVNAFGVEYALFINRDTLSINNVLVHGAAFNWNDEYHPQNALLNASAGEEIVLNITNTDSITHVFTIEGFIEDNNAIAPGDNQTFSLIIDEIGTYRYYSNVSKGKLLGASGQILIGFQDAPRFYWNLFDLDHQLTADIADGLTNEVPPDYRPELFFINGYSYPETLNDTTGYVTGLVGEEIVISIVNSGNMDHILHFHGYHVTILEADQIPQMVGWSKDSVPVKMNEALTLSLVPHQTGVYPVHDHNLIAVTNIGFYPGGMITHLNITE